MRRFVILSVLLLAAAAVSVQQLHVNAAASPFDSQSGTVTAVNAEQHQIQIKNEAGKEVTLVISESTTITREGKKVALGDLKPGDWVSSECVQSEDGYKASSIAASEKKPK